MRWFFIALLVALLAAPGAEAAAVTCAKDRPEYTHDQTARSRGFDYTVFINGFPLVASTTPPCVIDPHRVLFMNVGAMIAVQHIGSLTVFASTRRSPDGARFLAVVQDPDRRYRDRQPLSGTYWRFVRLVTVAETNGFNDPMPLFRPVQ